MSLKRNDPRHGTRNGYHNHGCRCQPCTVANSEYQRKASHRTGRHLPREAYLALLNTEPPHHGTESRYTSPRYRCRCEACKRASREARAQRRNRVAA